MRPKPVQPYTRELFRQRLDEQINMRYPLLGVISVFEQNLKSPKKSSDINHLAWHARLLGTLKFSRGCLRSAMLAATRLPPRCCQQRNDLHRVVGLSHCLF